MVISLCIVLSCSLVSYSWRFVFYFGTTIYGFVVLFKVSCCCFKPFFSVGT